MKSSWLPVVVILLAVFSHARAQEECDCDDVSPSSEFSCEQQKEFGKCEAGWLAEGGFCRQTCGACTPCGEGGDAKNPCDCPDVAPPGEFTCEQQESWGKCGEEWIISGGYCQGTCCNCPEINEPAPPPPATSECDCEDNPPPGDYTCAEQASWGKCSDEWMVSGNYCAKSCGTCQCSEEPQPADQAQDDSSIPLDESSPMSEDNEDSSSDKTLFDAEESLAYPQEELALPPAPEVESIDTPASESTEVAPTTEALPTPKISPMAESFPSSDVVPSSEGSPGFEMSSPAEDIDPITEEDEEEPETEPDSGT